MKKIISLLLLFLCLFGFVNLLIKNNLKYGPTIKSYIDYGLLFLQNNTVLINGENVHYIKYYVKPEGYQKLARNFYKNNEHVFFGDYIIKSADIATFEHIVGNFAKDKNHYFYGKDIYPHAQIGDDLKFLGNSYLKINNKIYFLDKHLSSADVITFEPILYNKDNSYDGYYGTFFAKDTNNIYYNDIILEGYDLESFKYLSKGIIHDKKGAVILNPNFDEYRNNVIDYENYDIDYQDFHALYNHNYTQGVFTDQKKIFVITNDFSDLSYMPRFQNDTSFNNIKNEITKKKCIQNPKKCFLYFVYDYENNTNTSDNWEQYPKGFPQIDWISFPYQDKDSGKKCYHIKNGKVFRDQFLVQYADAISFKELQESSQYRGCYAIDKNYVFRGDQILYASKIIY